MALSAKLISFILLLSILSSQIHARDSQFFNKVSHDNNVKDAQIPTKEEPLNKEKPEPKQTFTSENENSYGLYGQQSTQTTNYAPYITTADGGKIYDLEKDPLLNNQENIAQTKFQENHETYSPMTNQNDNYNSEKYYHPDQQDERFSRNSYSTKAYDDNYYNGQNYGRNEYNNYHEQRNFHYNGGNGNMYNDQQQDERFRDTRLADNGYTDMDKYQNRNYQYNGGKIYSNTEKKGMSDTRFLENGRYFYDISKDMYNPNFQYDNYGDISSRNEYSNRKYYADNEYNKNYMGGYQNQEEFEENKNDHFMP